MQTVPTRRVTFVEDVATDPGDVVLHPLAFLCAALVGLLLLRGGAPPAAAEDDVRIHAPPFASMKKRSEPRAERSQSP